MSISPPSDIVLDVARAADPARFQEAAAKLSQPGSAGATAFADAARDVGLSTHMPLDARGALTGLQNQTAMSGAGSDPYKKFEGLVLQQFVEAMMPEKSETVYGKGNAGGIWKSMLAEQIGTQIAKAGGIGIAKMLNAAHPGTPAAAPTDAANPAAKV
ncbi:MULTISPECIES: rod-binding protein [Methylobacterium]|jgi:flagellar protein FlgJ|uniref:Flagellar rod assembly protein FlgJ n=2 Tax=Methylobacterium TaxID=407 RepID=A0A0C6EX16_9HYPH|nr:MULTISPECIES: rod-binding protein [Methylobacterium]MBK3398308.1 rod-binding protein [Methylobacterium ajmalii]MBK3408487.1 rod-binding protein [Methylobacterium ajmalii]MBK3421036.1 rod-binding protein [Methylobacterium ajmalii]MBZ6414130.1 rod-binding protein [Methylobacterium sp.]SEO46602.1 Rod binding protein [Methylobacterium sp. ap11]